MLVIALAASTQVGFTTAQAVHPSAPRDLISGDQRVSTPPEWVATVTVPDPVTPVLVPTVIIPPPTPTTTPTPTVTPTPTATVTPRPTSTPRPTATPKPKAKKHRSKPHVPVQRSTAVPAPHQVWISAYLSSYCPGSAGWLSSSGLPVFYGMLANNYYPFGTHVYIPVINLMGVVEDRLGAFPVWNHFDVWSPTCYGTPTGWFKVAVQG